MFMCPGLIVKKNAVESADNLSLVKNMEASLFSAAKDGNLTAVKSVLRSGSCDVNIRDKSFYNNTPLHYACR